jgi:hypothetical protein
LIMAMWYDTLWSAESLPHTRTRKLNPLIKI